MTGEQVGGQRPAVNDRSGSAEPTLANPQSAIRNPERTLIHQLRSLVERLHLSDLFPTAQPFEVELGSGDGSFLATYAHAHPERNFLGVERLLGRLRKLNRKGLRLGLKNLKLIRLEASYVVEYLLPRDSVRALHIYFPDPWPKRRHHERRLVNPKFAEAARVALEPGGCIYLRTDDTEYFAQITEVFSANAGFREARTPEALSAALTDFERDFTAKGVPTLRAAYERSI